jgi:hypothetical protein
VLRCNNHPQILLQASQRVKFNDRSRYRQSAMHGDSLTHRVQFKRELYIFMLSLNKVPQIEGIVRGTYMSLLGSTFSIRITFSTTEHGVWNLYWNNWGQLNFCSYRSNITHNLHENHIWRYHLGSATSFETFFDMVHIWETIKITRTFEAQSLSK